MYIFCVGSLGVFRLEYLNRIYVVYRERLELLILGPHVLIYNIYNILTNMNLPLTDTFVNVNKFMKRKTV